MSTLAPVYAGEADLKVISDNVWHVLVAANDPPLLFRNGDRIVWIEEDDHGIPVMREVTPPRLIHHLVRICSFYKLRRGEPVSARPPKDLAAELLARRDKSALPLLRRISATPVLGSDGIIHATNEYDYATQLYFTLHDLDGLLPVESDPPDHEIEMAREFLFDDFLGDFPFTGPSERAHAFAAMLLPFIRPVVGGPTPLHLIEKPTPGTGGTLLAHVLCYPALGRFPSAVTQPHTESEWRYALLSWLRDGPTVILLDNLGDKLGSPSLASVVTSETFRDRVVGSSDALSIPVECLWVATANNPNLSTEIVRRCVRIRIDAQTEHPDMGRKFRHADLRGWVAQNRSQLVWAILTLVQAWIAAGRPPGDFTLGGFESWSEVVGGILKVAAVEGFLANRYELRRASNSETPQILAFVEKWWEAYQETPVGVAELFHLASDLDLGDNGEHSQRIRLGNRLDSLRDRCFGNFRLEKIGSYQNSQRYKLQWVSGGSQVGVSE